ncbi:hypothetical protein, partial [Sutterella sp.]|uniref:hypothetical protein n=1 Tax=Sutterella sp. TaxID=1981025 RepID=UPI0026DEC251
VRGIVTATAAAPTRIVLREILVMVSSFVGKRIQDLYGIHFSSETELLRHQSLIKRNRLEFLIFS